MREHKCPQCSQVFESPAALGGHMGKHARAAQRERAPAGAKGNGRQGHRCRECRRKFSSPWGLIAHQRVHRRRKGNGAEKARPSCPVCSHALPARVRNLATQFLRVGLSQEQATRCAALAAARLRA